MNDEASSIYAYTYMTCSLAKQIQSSFDKSLHCHEILVRMQIPKVLSARHAVVVVVGFFVFQESFLCPIL